MWLIRFSHSLSLIWFDREEGPCWKSLRNILAAFLPPRRRQGQEFQDPSFRVPVEGLSTTVPTAWLTSASGDAGKDGGESEQEWRCTHGRLQGGGGQQVGHKLVSWLFLTVERRRQTSGVLYFNMCPVSLGRCLPTKGTVMISVWQEREVKSASFILRP